MRGVPMVTPLWLRVLFTLYGLALEAINWPTEIES